MTGISNEMTIILSLCSCKRLDNPLLAVLYHISVVLNRVSIATKKKQPEQYYLHSKVSHWYIFFWCLYFFWSTLIKSQVGWTFKYQVIGCHGDLLQLLVVTISDGVHKIVYNIGIIIKLPFMIFVSCYALKLKVINNQFTSLHMSPYSATWWLCRKSTGLNFKNIFIIFWM